MDQTKTENSHNKQIAPTPKTTPKKTPNTNDRRLPFRPLQNHDHIGHRSFFSNSHLPRPQSKTKIDFTRSLYPQKVCSGDGFLNLQKYINPFTNEALHAFSTHYQKEIRNKANDSFKTVMCQNWLMNASCNFGKKCRFAHGEQELRQKRFPHVVNSKYKTKICQKYKKGVCPFGSNCLFIHEDALSEIFAQQIYLTLTRSVMD